MAAQFQNLSARMLHNIISNTALFSYICWPAGISVYVQRTFNVYVQDFVCHLSFDIVVHVFFFSFYSLVPLRTQLSGVVGKS